jgi:subtilisin-like proprotein convertase family protein
MKKQIGILMLVLLTFVSRAQLTNLTVTANPNVAIPDGNQVGYVSTVTVGGMFGVVTSISVNLNITGGFNGDLYAYLVSPQSSMVVLLNRVGISSANSFGYSDAGFNITLTAAGSNIHNYQSGSYTLSGGQLTGTWGADQRIVDPQGAPSSFDASPTGNNLNVYNGTDPNGVWTLFISDLSSGYQSTLVTWGLTVATVPEPQTWTLLGGGLAALWFTVRNRRK